LVAKLRIVFLIEATALVGPMIQLVPVSVRALILSIAYSVESFMVLPHLNPVMYYVHQ